MKHPPKPERLKGRNYSSGIYKPGRILYFLLHEFPDEEHTGPGHLREYIRDQGAIGVPDIGGEKLPCFSMDTSPL